MSLYVGLFRGDSEVDGWALGPYSDFGYFRQVVLQHFQAVDLPLLIQSSDCDALFNPAQLPILRAELSTVAARFRALPPAPPTGAFEHNRPLSLRAASLYECFHNVDGEILIEALSALCDRGVAENVPLVFQ